jgi:hypothetical protein
MSKRKKDASVCREDKRTQWEKERDARIERSIHTYPSRTDAWKLYEPYNRVETSEGK